MAGYAAGSLPCIEYKDTAHLVLGDRHDQIASATLRGYSYRTRHHILCDSLVKYITRARASHTLRLQGTHTRIKSLFGRNKSTYWCLIRTQSAKTIEIMPFHLENKINDVYQSSTATLKCVEAGPSELSAVALDVRHLSETIKLLADATDPSIALFDMATREQASELWSALEACDRNLTNIRSIWTSFAHLDWQEKSQFATDACLSAGGFRYLQSKLVSYATTLKNLLVSFKVSSTALNWPPNLDVLGNIQAELLAEGVQVYHLQNRHDEIKAYIRSLAIGEFDEPFPASISRVPPTPSHSPPMSVIPERQLSATTMPHSRHVTELADQFASLFEPRAIRRPSLVGIIVDSASPKQMSESTAMAETKRNDSIASTYPAAPARRDSMDPTAISLVSRLSAAMADMALSVGLQSKPHSSRPPPERSSSAVFRGLANEERATGD
jgi:hypothetical protein